jgi:hypothetical protein
MPANITDADLIDLERLSNAPAPPPRRVEHVEAARTALPALAALAAEVRRIWAADRPVIVNSPDCV